MTIKTIAFTCICVLLSQAAQAQQYEIFLLDSLGGIRTFPQDINEHGQIVGSSTNEAGASLPFLYHDGELSNLSLLGFQASRAYGINDYGSIVGGNQILHADGSITEIPPPSNFYSGASGYAINNAGHVVGSMFYSYGNGHRDGFLHKDGETTIFSQWRIAADINDKGAIVGSGLGGTVSSNYKVRFFNGEETLELLGSEAVAINNSNEFVGEAHFSPYLTNPQRPTGTHATQFIGTERLNLAASSYDIAWGSIANDINDAGIVVGRINEPYGNYQAFIYSKEAGMQILEDLVVNMTPEMGKISNATAINSRGEITGYLYKQNPASWRDGIYIGYVAIPLAMDNDEDGIPNSEDECPNSNPSPTLYLDDCNTSIANSVDINGCKLSDSFDICQLGQKHPFKYFKCIKRTAKQLFWSQAISRSEKRTIKHCAIKNIFSEEKISRKIRSRPARGHNNKY